MSETLDNSHLHLSAKPGIRVRYLEAPGEPEVEGGRPLWVALIPGGRLGLYGTGLPLWESHVFPTLQDAKAWTAAQNEPGTWLYYRDVTSLVEVIDV